jgi:purine-nucleoside phosphorylase
MPQIHLRAEAGDYAPIVLLPGDPNRATRVAGLFDGGLDASRLVNENRLLYGYTGKYQGVPVSVQTTGMGAPSISIVVEELLRLGARRLIRIGTCGSIGRGIHAGELVIASSATPLDGATASFVRREPYAPTADFGITRLLAETAEARGARYHVGPVATIDVFSPYLPDPDFNPRWRARGILAFEMEASALFYLAAKATAAGGDVRAGTILSVSDAAADETTSAMELTPQEVLDRSVREMIEIALEAAIRSL